jgi:antitoxin component YwqK of YwqJK toxin-antitoxin module
MRLLALVLILALGAACRPEETATMKRFYSDGRLAESRQYTHGEKTGVHRGWWDSGMPKFECRFVAGRSEGDCREWYSSGRLATIHRFKDGAETGLQRGWSANGAPQFSYEMRNGRRYGLLGALNCKTGVRSGGAL